MNAMANFANASAKTRTTILLNMASIMEKADEQVLPAVYFFIMRSLKCTPSQLGTLTLCRALVQVSHLAVGLTRLANKLLVAF